MTIGSTGSDEVSMARALARTALAVDLGRFDADVIAKAKICLLDFLSCAFEARNHPWSRQAIGIAREAASGATIIGTRTLASPGDAAFANATMGHGLVREDMHAASICHHGVVIWPTLLALSERTPLSGATFLAAAIIGYEAGAQIGRALFTADLARLYRPTGLVAPLGAALAGSYALGLGEDAATSAIAIAANTSSGLNEWPRAGGSEMYFHPGFAARNAIAAIELAEAGARASETILEGEAGLFAAFRRQPAPAGIRLFAGPQPGDHGRLQQAGSRLQFCADRGADSLARSRANSGNRKISRRFRSVSRKRRPATPAATPRGLSQRAAGQDEHSLQRRRRARARCARRGKLRAKSTIPGFSASSNRPICKARPASPPRSRPTRAPRFSLACATERRSISASTMSLPRRRRKSAPAFEQAASDVIGSTRARHLEELVDNCASLPDSRVIAARCRA